MRLGIINGYVVSRANCGNVRLEYDGTIKGLTKACVAKGLSVGSVVTTDMGSKLKLMSAPHDNRAGGYWMDELRVS